MFSKRLSPLRAATVVALAAILASAVAVTPSFAGSLFSNKQAAHVFISKKKANRLFLTNQSAKNHFLKKKTARNQFLRQKTARVTLLKQKTARKTYVQKVDLPEQPTAIGLASTALFGPVSSKTPVDVPTTLAEFSTDDSRLVFVTFSGTSLCTGGTSGVACPIQLLIDGIAASTGKVNFDRTTAELPVPASTVHTVSQTGYITPGDHTISVQYAGSPDASVNFKLTKWDLHIQAFPEE